jgi:hypothetical protein
MRDAPTTARLQKYASFAQATGPELASTYADFLEKRRKFKSAPQIKPFLDEILSQNEKLIDDVGEFNPATFFTAVGQVAAMVKAIDEANEAAEKKRDEEKKKRLDDLKKLTGTSG